MDSGDLRNFLVFATGMPFFNVSWTTITITPKPLPAADLVKWPEWPLPKSFTCFNQIHFPCLAATPSSDSSVMVLTPRAVLDNLKRAAEHNGADFSDI